MKSKTLFYLVVLTLFTSLIPAMHAQTYSVIHSFTGGAGGATPYAGVSIRGSALYGTTGGPKCGTVYQLSHSGSNWSLSTLAALPHNCFPEARVVFGPDGHLYGTSYYGGGNDAGTVFKLTPPVGICQTAACYWTVNDLHDFGSGTDGQNPYLGDLIWDQQGNIYGTTNLGGTSGTGTVYELTPSGNGYTESFLYSFLDIPDGEYPQNSLVFDNNGNLFGTTFRGGANDAGTIFELSYVKDVGWAEQVLYNFQDVNDGQLPVGGLITDAAGNLYGTTLVGGSGGSGTVFELSPSGSTWTFKLLYSFSGNGQCGPADTLSMNGAGNLYGTTYCAGIYNNGSVFKLSNTETGWVYTSLHDFTGGSDGGSPYSAVTFDTDGALYGTASGGGTFGQGVVWMIKP